MYTLVWCRRATTFGASGGDKMGAGCQEDENCFCAVRGAARDDVTPG